MTRKLQILRGTTSQNNSYTGSAGELTMDTTLNEVRIHDGSTAGGHALAKKASIPTVNDATITVTQGGATKGTFTTNQSSASTIALDAVPTVNDSTITITQGGVTKGTFTTNQASASTIALDAVPSGRNVGDIFYTTRTDNELNGAVDCDGSTYNTTDFTGSESIGDLLEDGKVPYVSMADYATEISTKGWCDKFGWDGTGNISFKVPTLTPHIVQKNNIPVESDGSAIQVKAEGSYRTLYIDKSSGGDVRATPNVSANANIVDINHLQANTTNTLQPRIMVQLFVSASDEAVATCNSVLSDVAALKYDYVVEFQAPTAQNNYTWYRKYKSGWVEQGGIATTVANTGVAVSFPIEMTDTNYQIQITCKDSPSSYSTGILNNTVATTGITISTYTESRKCCWEVKGIAAN